jgi:hypothetical protein
MAIEKLLKLLPPMKYPEPFAMPIATLDVVELAEIRFPVKVKPFAVMLTQVPPLAVMSPNQLPLKIIPLHGDTDKTANALA